MYSISYNKHNIRHKCIKIQIILSIIFNIDGSKEAEQDEQDDDAKESERRKFPYNIINILCKQYANFSRSIMDSIFRILLAKFQYHISLFLSFSFSPPRCSENDNP